MGSGRARLVGAAVLCAGLAACGGGKPKPPPPSVDILVEVPSVPPTGKGEREVIGRMVIENFSSRGDRLIRATASVAGTVDILETVPPPPPAGPERIVPVNVTTPADPPPRIAGPDDDDAERAIRGIIPREGTAPADYRSRHPIPAPVRGTIATEVARVGTAPADAQARAQATGAAPIPGPPGGPSAILPQPIPIQGTRNAAVVEFVRAEAVAPKPVDQPIVRVTHQGVGIPPGSRIVFQPGGYQLRFNRLGRELAAGGSFRVNLHFQNAGTIVVPFVVRTPAEERAPFPPPSRKNPYTPADPSIVNAGPPPALVVPTIRN